MAQNNKPLSVAFGTDAIVLNFGNETEARSALEERGEFFAHWASQFGKKKAVLKYGGKRPFMLPARWSASLESVTMEGKSKQPPMTDQLELLGADYIAIHEFLIQQKQDGNIVIITSNKTRDRNGKLINTENPEAGRDICYHTNDLLLPSRSSWEPGQFTGYNYRLSWRKSSDNYSELNPQYQQLKDLLARDGEVRDYEYTLYRPDGAFCSYSTSYFLCRNYCGDEVRIGVSRPQDWNLIEASPKQVSVS